MYKELGWSGLQYHRTNKPKLLQPDIAHTMASTANDIARLLNLGNADSSALADVFSEYFGDKDDSGSEDQEDSEIWGSGLNQGRHVTIDYRWVSLAYMQICAHFFSQTVP